MGLTHPYGVRRTTFLPDQIEVGAANEVRCAVYFNGLEVYPDSGTVTIRRSGGAVLVDAAAATVEDGASSRYVYDAPTTIPFEEGGVVRWELTFDNGIGEAEGPVTLAFENEAVFVRCRPTCPIAIEHVWMVAPALKPAGTGGAITVMTRAEQEGMLENAWIQVEQRLLSAGRRPYLVIGASALVEVTRLTFLALAFGALGHRLNEAHTATAESYRLQAEEAWKRVRLTYDETQLGGGDNVRVSARRAGVFLGRGGRR